MRERQQAKKRRSVPWLLGLLVLGLLVFLIMLQSSNLWKSFSVDTASDTLLLYGLSSLNFIALVIFGFIFLRSVVKLVRERRALELGSKIKTRLLVYFALISLLPIIAMAVFSYLFMNRALDRWFAQIPASVTEQARDVEQQAASDQTAKLQDTVRMLAIMIEKRDVADADLDAISAAGNLTRIEILNSDGSVLRSSGKPVSPEQQTELDSVLSAARGGLPDNTLLQDGRGYDAAVADLSSGRKLLIVPDVHVNETVGQKVDNSLAELERLKQQQNDVRLIGLLTLGVLTFLLIFASSWTAFYIARGLTIPIKALAEGSDQIAQGNLSHRVDVFAEDELAILVGSFNAMAERLEESSQTISEGRRYIETVLDTLPTGVISFNGENRVTTINRAAKSILHLEEGGFVGFGLETLVGDDNRAIIEKLLSRARRIGHASEQTTLRRVSTKGRAYSDGQIPTALIAAALPGGSGCVLVIEDLSELISAQRASAWQEVARRMAHEIKNPLTPIQLSAERIAKRASLEPATVSTSGVLHTSSPQADVIKEGTDTILREVAGLKAMVDEFSRFARLPNVSLERGSVNDVIQQTVAMYEGRFADIDLKTELEADLHEAMIDTEQLKRVFVNLVENSIEAFEVDGDGKQIFIRSRFDRARETIVIEISDNGKGIDPADFQKLFQPYFSTKGRGTGLGLAIVNRIIADHHGKINAANSASGAKFTIELPVAG
jgi:two-component system, NtrC family, nitrogen regulation sensor histidine kinase NtrY